MPGSTWLTLHIQPAGNVQCGDFGALSTAHASSYSHSNFGAVKEVLVLLVLWS